MDPIRVNVPMKNCSSGPFQSGWIFHGDGDCTNDRLIQAVVLSNTVTSQTVRKSAGIPLRMSEGPLKSI